VRIEQRQYLELKAWFTEVAIHRRKESLEAELRKLPFEPYAPVRSQLFVILREMNSRRYAGQQEVIPSSSIRIRRKVVRPFGQDSSPEEITDRSPNLQRDPCMESR
jgi:hypothetical protein